MARGDGKKKRKFGVKRAAGKKSSAVRHVGEPRRVEKRNKSVEKPRRSFGVKGLQFKEAPHHTHVVVQLADQLRNIGEEIAEAVEQDADVLKRWHKVRQEIQSITKEALVDSVVKSREPSALAIPKFKPYAFDDPDSFSCQFECQPVHLNVGWTHPWNCPFWETTEHTPF